MPAPATMIIITTTIAIETVLLIALLNFDDLDENIMDFTAIIMLKILLPLGPFEYGFIASSLRPL